MSAEIDRVLAIVDGGLQRSDEFAMLAGNPSRCWRCQIHEPADASELCSYCRGFLLEEPDAIDVLAPDGVYAHVRAEVLEAIIQRAIYGDGTGEPMGIAPAEIARIREALDEIARVIRAALESMVDAIARFLNSIDWSEIRRIVDELDEARRDHHARRTLAHGRRENGRRPLAPPRDLRTTEAPRVAPDPRRKNRP